MLWISIIVILVISFLWALFSLRRKINQTKKGKHETLSKIGETILFKRGS